MNGAAFYGLHRTAKTMLLKYVGKSDLRRWENEANLFESWDVRTKLLASLVSPGSTVLEFGAGRMVLPRYLPEECVYIPSDIVDRGCNTFLCDLNAAQLPPLPPHDVAVFSGVLEYVHDVERLVACLGKYRSSIVASYAVTDFANQKPLMSRRKHGWVNDYSVHELQCMFSKQGFQWVKTVVWENQQYLFKLLSLAPPVDENPDR